MSQPTATTVSCPSCHESSQVEIWSEIDAATEPDAAQWLIDGFVFEFTCEACGATAKLNHNFVLKDSSQLYMVVYLAKQSQLGDALKSIEDMRKRGWTVRLAESRDALREKAALLRDGLDDRAVEMAKYILKTRFAKEGQLPETAQARYGALSEEGIVVEFVGAETPLETTFPKSIYDSVKETLEDDQPLSVNPEWAARALDQRGWKDEL